MSGEGVDGYDVHYPGDDVVDVLATDVYQNGFARDDYEQLLVVAGDKPIALGEVGMPPTPEILCEQPRWTWFMLWAGPSRRWQEQQAFQALYESDATISLEELPWVNIAHPTIHHPVLK